MISYSQQELNSAKLEFKKLKEKINTFPLKVSQLYKFYKKQQLPQILKKPLTKEQAVFIMLTKYNRQILLNTFQSILEKTLQLLHRYLKKNKHFREGIRLQHQIQIIIVQLLPQMKQHIHLSNQYFIQWHLWKYKLRLLFQQQLTFIKQYYQIYDQKVQIKTLVYNFFQNSQQKFKIQKPEFDRKLISNIFKQSAIRIQNQYQFDEEELKLQKQVYRIQQQVNKISKIRIQKQQKQIISKQNLSQYEPSVIKLQLKKIKSTEFQETYQQKKLSMKSNLSQQHYLNLTTKFTTDATDLAKILSLGKLSKKQLKQQMNNKCLDCTISIIRFSIKQPIQLLKRQQSSFNKNYPSKLFKEFKKYQDTLLEQINTIQTCKQNSTLAKFNDKQFLYQMIVLFYKIFKQQYTVVTKQYLSKVCMLLQMQIQTYNLRSVLKIIQDSDFNQQKRSIIAKRLSQEPAYRSPNNKKSKQSLVLAKQYTFKNPTQTQEIIDLQMKKIQNKNKWKFLPQIQFVKLNFHSLQRISKTLNLFFSGYMSQDTAKDSQWYGLYKAIGSSSLVYAIRWPSSTKVQTLKGIVKLGAVAVQKLLSFVFPTQQLKQQIQSIFGKQDINTFRTAYDNAKATGQYIADFIMEHFSDRFINLVGYSLGTVVIFHCLKRLSDCGKLGLIHRVLTMGGVADQQDITELLKKTQCPVFWTNIQSEGDLIVKWVFKLHSLWAKVIGSKGIQPLFGHQIENLQMGSDITGHLQYRYFLNEIGLMKGLQFD